MFKAVVRGVIVSLALVLWAILVGGVSVAAAANPLKSGHAYDTSLHAYDTATNSVQAHTGEVAPVGSQDASEGVQGAAVTATGPLAVLLPGFVAANSEVGQLVIGKVPALEADGALASGERTLLSQLPNQGNEVANWAQNERVLLQEMESGNPIRDASVSPATGAFVDDTGFLYRERTLMSLSGWQYDPATTLWSPGG